MYRLLMFIVCDDVTYVGFANQVCCIGEASAKVGLMIILVRLNILMWRLTWMRNRFKKKRERVNIRNTSRIVYDMRSRCYVDTRTKEDVT